MRRVGALELGEAFELPLVELPFPVDRLIPPPLSEEELKQKLAELRRDEEAIEKKAAWLALGSALTNFVPGVGEGKGLSEAWHGYDLVTGKEKAWYERFLNVVSCLPVIHQAKGVVNLVSVMGKVGHTAHKANLLVHGSHLYSPLKEIALDKGD